MGVGSPRLSLRSISKGRVSHALVNDAIQVPFESFSVTSIVLNCSLSLLFIDEDSPHVHFEDGGLKSPRQGISTRGLII